MAKGPRATVKPARRATIPSMNLLEVST